MFLQIWRKEYLKLNKALLVLLFIHVGIALYHYLRIRSLFIVNEPILIWNDIIEMGGIFFSRFEKPLYLSAAALGILQFYPETDKRRFRISCHLPIKEEVMLASMLAFCIAAISVYWLIGLIAAILTGVVYFPRQLYAEQPFIMFFWYIKALIFYAAVAVIMLEISWKDRLKRGIMLAGFYCLISAPSYNASEFYLIPLILTALIFIPAVYYPALRFRKGGDL